MTGSVALSGDSIISRRISTLDDPGIEALAEVFRGADVGFTHFETLVHNFDDEGVYAPAQPGEMAMRSPAYVIDELQWLGIDLVSHASNHALDYGYGGLRSTWEAMAERGVPIAGTGEDLGEARGAAYLDTPMGRVALLSMTTSFTPWSRAGEARYDHRGRPGQNVLSFHHEVDAETLETIKATARQLGQWITEFEDGEWAIHPPGLHNSITRYYESDDADGARMVVDERDREGNLRAIRDAAQQADFVITHLHTHAWDPDGTLADPPEFVQRFARDCVDAGTDCFVGQGSHSPLRPIEIYDGTPIFYDPGDLVSMVTGVPKQPLEFYERFAHDLDVDPRLASPADAYAARPLGFNDAEYPPGGYTGTPYDNSLVVPVCDFDDDMTLERITLYPATVSREEGPFFGVPSMATGASAEGIIDDVGGLSEPFDTDVRFEDGVGVVEP